MMMTTKSHDEIVSFLRKVRHRSLDEPIHPYIAELAQLKAESVQSNDEVTAKELWCLETTLDVQSKYVESFVAMKNGQFYEGWCLLEQAELSLRFLQPHRSDAGDPFALDFISTKIQQLQALFPYDLFMSPEIVEISKKCNICDQAVSIRNPCGHRVGEIYGGELCVRIVTDARLVGSAFVRHPVQKYSVPFSIDKYGNRVDHYDYSVISYLIRRLPDPYQEWVFKKSFAQHPHSHYRNVGRNSPCPCGSQKKYKNCCLKEAGVMRPHFEFKFAFSLPPELQAVEYSRH